MKKSRNGLNFYHHRDEIPKPAEKKRIQKLPWEQQKSVDEDPDAPLRVKAILESPNYRTADADADFLKRNDTRGIRLQVDYLKAELLLEQYGIKDTVVVFGGTRIVEKSQATRMLAERKAALKKDPDNESLQEDYAIAKRILKKSAFYDVGREFGRIVGTSGKGPSDCSLTLMTGGGPGVMEAANRGAFDVGAKSIGLNITLPQEQYPNPYITPELTFQFHYFSMRKLHFLRRARALVAFPGGFGTLDELLESLTLIQTRKIPPFPIVLVGKSFWDSVIDFDFLLCEGVIDPEDIKLFWYAETAQEIWDGIIQWHKENGTPLLVDNAC